MGAYNATKYAVESLSDALRNELHPFGIRVSLVEPGYIQDGVRGRGAQDHPRPGDVAVCPHRVARR